MSDQEKGADHKMSRNTVTVEMSTPENENSALDFRGTAGYMGQLRKISEA